MYTELHVRTPRVSSAGSGASAVVALHCKDPYTPVASLLVWGMLWCSWFPQGVVASCICLLARYLPETTACCGLPVNPVV